LEIHLFGITTSTGQSFLRALTLDSLSPIFYSYTRHPNDSLPFSHFCDLSSPRSFDLAGTSTDSQIWISFAPIWLFSDFFCSLVSLRPRLLDYLKGVIVCSSSSALTKRFAFNAFDRELATRLKSAEDNLLADCKLMSVNCSILRPSLIYGRVGSYRDSNISLLISAMRRFPVLPLPMHSGLRQPIHASQLASCFLHIARELMTSCPDKPAFSCINVGGDSQLSYSSMIKSTQDLLQADDPARNCRILLIPTKIFYFLSFFLLFKSSKHFEAALRICSNLSGFTPAHQITNSSPQRFPVLPLSD